MTSKVLIAVFLVGLTTGLMWLLLGSVSGRARELTVPVRYGDLHVVVRAPGKIESGNATRVETRVGGRVLTYVVPEGTMVRKGKILARFDETALRERVLTRRNDLEMAGVRLAEKEERRKVRRQEVEAQIKMLEADLAIKSTEHDRTKSLPYPDQVTRAKLDRDYYASRLRIAKQDLEIIKVLTARGAQVFSREELREKELAYARAQGELEKAENQLKDVQAGASPLELDAAERELAKAEIALAQARRKLPEQITILDVDVRSAKTEVDKMQVRLDHSLKDLDQNEVKAPVDGMLVYRTIHGRPIQLGDQFWRRAHLFDIADLDNMIVKAKVNEAEYALISTGMSVRIRAFSMPDRVFKGKIVEVAKVAKDRAEGELTSWRQVHSGGEAGIQAFDVTIAIEDRSPYIKPNVEAEVIVSCKTIPDVLTIPVTAVFEKSGRKYVRVLNGRRVETREITPGESAGEWIVVTQGLAAGEDVLLTVREEEAGL